MDRKRIFIDRKTSPRQRIEIVKWAAQNNYEAIVFPMTKKLNEKSDCIKLAKKYELCIEAGGHELSLLIQRRLFFFRSGLFRMEQGRRKLRRHFCPTNPATTALIKRQIEELFVLSMEFVTEPRVFHLLPDKGYETSWCACPACRAFSPAEQYIISVNCAADVLAKLDSEAKLGYQNFDLTAIAPGVTPRKNMFITEGS